MARLLPSVSVTKDSTASGFNPTMVRLLQGKNLGFGSKMRRNEKEVAVDLQLPEKPKDDKRPFKIGSFWAKIATLTLFGFQSAQNGLG